MRRVVLNRNGQISPKGRETSDLKAGQFKVGEHVMLSITGDCCYHRKAFEEFEVIEVKPCSRFGGGRETVTFQRVPKRGGEVMAKTQNNPFIGDELAIQVIWKVIWPAVKDDYALATFLTNRAYVRGIPLNDLRGKRRDALITRILNVSLSEDGRDELIAIAQTVAILGEGMKISRELATAAKNATGL